MTPIRSRGVTLVELIVVIVITGIIGTAVAFFIRRPVEGYIDASRRAALTDQADTALRRITRDLRLALPNSVRVSGQFIEYIETTGGGRYRAEVSSTGTGNILDFSAAVPTFDVLGPVPPLLAGNHIVVYNLYNTGTTSNAYFGDNRVLFAGLAAQTITIAPVITLPFPAPSPAKRFHVVSGPVTYGCVGSQLIRYSGYNYNEPQVTPPVGGTSSVLVANVGECQFAYTPGALSEQIATVSILMRLDSIAAGSGTESVRLFQQAQVSNSP